MVRFVNDSEKFRKIQDEAFELFKRKNAEYGSAFRDNGPVGMVIRAGEKLRRLMTVSKNKIVVDDETLRDTMLDLHNVSALGIMLYDEEVAMETGHIDGIDEETARRTKIQEEDREAKYYDRGED